jgi:hypothetical protein
VSELGTGCGQLAANDLAGRSQTKVNGAAGGKRGGDQKRREHPSAQVSAKHSYRCDFDASISGGNHRHLASLLCPDSHSEASLITGGAASPAGSVSQARSIRSRAMRLLRKFSRDARGMWRIAKAQRSLSAGMRIDRRGCFCSIIIADEEECDHDGHTGEKQ